MADPEANYEYAEVPVRGEISSAQQATPAELVKLARTIWSAVKASGVRADDEAGNDSLLERLQGEYKDFNISFPLVLRWMVQMRKFNAKAFEKYLLKHAAAKLDTREAFLSLQADYLVFLYREEHKHPNEAFIKRYRSSIIEQLLAEDKAFMEMQKQVDKDLAAKATADDHDRRQALYAYLMAARVAREKEAAVLPAGTTPAAAPPGDGEDG
jgi:hypothetical protein